MYHFKKVLCKGKDRFDKTMLKEFLESNYETKLGQAIYRQLTDPKFFDFRNTANCKDTEYVANILKFINVDRKEQC